MGFRNDCTNSLPNDVVLLDEFEETVIELVPYLSLNIDPRTTKAYLSCQQLSQYMKKNAHLPLVLKRSFSSSWNCLVQIDIIKNQRGILSPEFE